MPKDRDTTRTTRRVFGARDELPAATPGSAEGELDRAEQSRGSAVAPTPGKAEGDLFPEGSDRPPTKSRG